MISLLWCGTVAFEKSCVAFSPFDQRCIGLHDPRVASTADPWLPHSETALNSVAKSGANVDKLYHQRLASVYTCSPIYGYIPRKKWKADNEETFEAWRDFYGFVCNFAMGNSSSSPQRPRKFEALNTIACHLKVDNEMSPQHNFSALGSDLCEMQAIEVVLKIRECKLGQSYLYFPTHLLCGELCMILQERIFYLVPRKKTENSSLSFTLLEDRDYKNLSEAVKKSSKMIIVHEIAFGPVGDPSVRPLSIWFDIPRDRLVACTSQQAKRHKRSRHRLKKSSRREVASSLEAISIGWFESESEEILKMIDSTEIHPFCDYQPIDIPTFNLVTDILSHRLLVLKTRCGLWNYDEVQSTKTSLCVDEQELIDRFVSLRRHWVTWSWPVQFLEDEIDEMAEVPSIDSEYKCIIDGIDNFQTESFHGFNDERLQDVVSSCMTAYAPAFIWKSFISYFQVTVEVSLHEKSLRTKLVYLHSHSTHSIFSPFVWILEVGYNRVSFRHRILPAAAS